MVQAGVRWGATMGIAPDPFRFRTTPLLQPARADDRSYASDAHARPAGAAASRQGSVWPETSGRPSAGVLRVGDPQRASGLLVSRQGSEGAAPRGITPVQPSTKGTFPAGLMPGLPR